MIRLSVANEVVKARTVIQQVDRRAASISRDRQAPEAHNRIETPLFAKSIERHALRR